MQRSQNKSPKKLGNLAVKRIDLESIEASFLSDKNQNGDQEHQMLDGLISECLRAECGFERTEFGSDGNMKVQNQQQNLTIEVDEGVCGNN